MLKITLACFENDSVQITKVKELMYKQDTSINRKTPFSINKGEVNKVIKSNLIPMVLPKKIYEFKIDTSDGVKEWDVCKELRKKRIVIVPFAGKLYSFSNSNEIKKELSFRLDGEINVIETDKHKFENIGLFKELAISSIAEVLSRKEGFEFDRKSKIWTREETFQKRFGTRNIVGFQGVRLSLMSDLNNIYVAFLPMCYIEDYKSYDKASVSSFYKQFDLFVSGGKPNYGVESYIKKWIKQLIGENILTVDYSSDQEKMTFKFGCNSLYVGLKAYNYKGNSIPQYVSSKQIALKGEELEDPQLCFYNPQYKSYVSDFHPMRGLINNQPYDFSMGMELQKQEVNIGVLCPVGYEENLIHFLNGLKNKHNAHVNPDYLLPYPGFSNVYGTSLNIPEKESKNWMSYESVIDEDNKKACYKLGAKINNGLSKLHENNNIDVILVYIPNDYEVFSNYKDEEGKFDLHDYVKAYAVQNNISTQFLREDTIKSNLDCQIAWSLSLAFYVKSLRTPWILSKQDEDVAYAGIGYSLSHGNDNNFIVGCSHIYSSNGQGKKYKLSRLTDFTLDHKKNPYLSEEEAYKLGVSIKELFFKSFSELHKRVVVHKRTRFTKKEITGLVNSLIGKGIEQLDLVEINYEDNARFF